MGRGSNMSIYNRSPTTLIGPYSHSDGGPSPPPQPPATWDMTILVHSARRPYSCILHEEVRKKWERGMATGMEMEVAASELSAVTGMAMEVAASGVGAVMGMVMEVAASGVSAVMGMVMEVAASGLFKHLGKFDL